MSMLQRYKKKGGFLQLLNLMETTGPAKQEKFMKMIEDEDPRWAEALKTKMLSIRKIFAWGDQPVAEIAGRLNDLALATALHGLDAEVKAKVYKMMGASRQRKIDDLMAEKKPTPAEISTVFVQILTEVRGMIDAGYVYLEKIDPTLVVDPDIEEKLASQTLYSMGHSGGSTAAAGAGGDKPLSFDMPAPGAASKSNDPAVVQELDQLRRKLRATMEENKVLADKLHHAENKLAQIRKIA